MHNRLYYEITTEGPELKGKEADIERRKNLIRRTGRSGHGSGGSGPKWPQRI